MRVLQAFGDINDIQPDKAIRVGLTQNIPEIVKEIVKHLKTIGFYSHTTYARDIWRMLARARDYKYWTHGRKS